MSSHTRPHYGTIERNREHRDKINFLCQFDFKVQEEHSSQAQNSSNDEQFLISYFVGENSIPTPSSEINVKQVHFAPIFVPHFMHKVELIWIDGEPSIYGYQPIEKDINDIMLTSLKGPLGADFAGDHGCPQSYAIPELKNSHHMLFHYRKTLLLSICSQ